MKVAIVAKTVYPIMTGGAEIVTRKVYDFLKQKFNAKLFLKYKTKLSVRPELGTECDLKWTKEILREIKKFDPDIIFVTRYWGELIPLYIEDKPIFAIHPSVEIEKYNIDNSYKEYLINICKDVFSRDNIIHIVPSQYAKEYYIKYSQNAQIYVVPLGFNKITSPINIRESKKLNNKNNIVITYVGRIAQKKGLEFFLRTLCDLRLRNCKIILAGKIMIDYYITFKKVLKEYQDQLNINYLGYISEKNKIKLLMESDITVQSSLYGESFGIACLECLYYNGLLLASDIFCRTGVVNEKCCIVFDKNNLEEKILSCMNLSIEEINNIVINARIWSEQFTWEKFKMNLYHLLNIFL